MTGLIRKGTAGSFHHWNKDDLRKVASKGGASVEPHKRSFSMNNELAKRAGKIGGSKGKKK